MNKTFALEALSILAFLVIATTIIGYLGLDMRLEKMFYSADKGWSIGEMQPWKFLYHYGNIPALLLSVGSLVLLLMSFISLKYMIYRKIAMFFVLVMLIGPGLVVNLGFKSYWGRNRPRHVEELGGQDRYMEIWETGTAGQGKSFPCGHATMGFYLFAPYFLARGRKRWMAAGFLALGLVMGFLIGLARMLQGGHFLSDVLWAGGMVYLVTLLFYRLLRLDRNLLLEERNVEYGRHRKTAIWVGIPLVLVAVATFLLASPYYKHRSVALENERLKDKLLIEIDKGDLILVSADSLEIEWKAGGFGFPGSKVRNNWDVDLPDGMKLKLFHKGFFTEYDNEVQAMIPWEKLRVLEIVIDEGDLYLEDVPTDVQVLTDRQTIPEEKSGTIILVDLRNGKLMSERGGK